ncbi:alanine--tRNA ligase, partial [Candidatus Parcubacteria bacterium]|nr:alanine--tRNA ligase [Candidatus Parcubacteria bacterium]
MNASDLRTRFLEFFRSHGHAIVPSSSLLPQDDPSVLLTTAGMQQFKPYLTGRADPLQHFGSKNVCSIQKSFRTTDIDEVGDTSHLTFFEMVGNFSFGGYFKEGAIPLSFEFITSSDGMGLDPHRLFVTAFKGDREVARDEEAIRLWQEQFRSVGIDAQIGERIFLYGREKNWWEAGVGPAGPDAEMFYDFGIPHDPAYGPTCHPNCDCGRFIEIGNDVFVQYNKTIEGTHEPLAQKAIDNGRGFERLVMVLQGKKTIFDTDLFQPLIACLRNVAAVLPAANSFTRLYMPGAGLGADMEKALHDARRERAIRIVADHLRAAAFLIADGVRPSNKEAGYILRRLIRRAVVNVSVLLNIGGETDTEQKLAAIVIDQYGPDYPELKAEARIVQEELAKEKDQFLKTLDAGLKEFEKIIKSSQETVSGVDAFALFATHGFPLEMTEDLAEDRGLAVDRDGFTQELEKHRAISRAGVEKKFGGHGMTVGDLTAADETELKIKTRLHTATHLLHEALRDVLGPHVEVRGSDISAVRLGFDFSHAQNMTPDEVKR